MINISQKNHIVFFAKLNKNIFYMKIIDLDDIYNFLVLNFSFEVVKMLKKINDIFRLKGIFDFSHLQLDTVRAQFDGSGMEGKKCWSSDAEDR